MRRTPFDSSIRLYPIKPFQTALTPAFCSAAVGPLKYSSTAALIGFTEDRTSRVTAFSTGALFSSDFLSGNTILTLTTSGVAVVVIVGVGVFVGVTVGVLLGLRVGVREGVEVIVSVGVKVEVDVGLGVGVLLGVREGVTVAVAEGLTVRVDDGVMVGVLLGVSVGVREGVAVLFTMVDVGVSVAPGVDETSRQAGVESTLPYGLRVLPFSS